ncbi:dynein-related subfamily AAA family protein [Barrientosiimonas humi]|uniref:Dynein-related subfamily AAA family protein n=1 Tax=Barrientosiimonas humi TaxID=999931 RepID=A0A542X8T7_9MICO|nr:AAA family ATPase [Barrientosiimonas humi]TQL32166.1 dynein-related subfamily AAA family protein [Barrientosiimonas humi]CAG7572154.1 5-methylcytosine-specific restriction enzyme B [Barrientosiimonas humi]
MTLQYADEVADPSTYMPRHPSAPQQVASQDAGRLSEVLDYIAAAGFTFEPWQVATFVTALRTKPFLILAGISGTGKTKLPQLVAEATGAQAVIVPVRPDWTDSSDLLGYERLTGDFVPGHLLTLCEQAMRTPDTQFFFVLDEMNVARVEYYFAEVLSVMENRRAADGMIVSEPLNRSAPNQTDKGGVDWSAVHLPANVSIVGTVNMDETTHGFSRKVLDRAFVLELSEVDLADYASVSRKTPTPAPWSFSAWAPAHLRLADVPDPQSNDAVVEAVNALVRANESLQQAQLQVGFRVRDEVALFCLNAMGSKEYFVDRDETVIAPLDLCLSMKILPRLQGGGAPLRDVLKDLESWTAPSRTDVSDSESPSGFRRTHERVRLMQQRLDQTGFTSYWV